MREGGFEIRGAIEAIVHDLRGVDLTPAVDVWDPRMRAWVYRTQDDEGPEGFDDDSYVAVLAGSQRLIGTIDSGPDLVELVGMAQDWAIDNLGFGWPELVDEQGEYVEILQPAEANGSLVWRSHDHVVAIGLLSSAKIRTRA